MLNQRDDTQYVIFHGTPPAGSAHHAACGPFSFPNVFVHNRELRAGAGKSLIYQPLLRDVLGGAFDAIVIGTHLQFASNHVVLVQRKLFRRPVLYWGHGYEKGAGVRLKYLLARVPDGYLVYTSAGARQLLANGVPATRVTVVPNTLDMETEIRLHGELQNVEEPLLRDDLGLRPDSVVLTYLGRMYPNKRVGSLIDAVRVLNSENRTSRSFEVVVIGDGPEAADLARAASDLPNVIFTGAVYDQHRIASYMRATAAVVMPGVIGLVANHALAHGVPLIHQESTVHSPELEYLTPDRDVLVAGGFADFVNTLARFIDSAALQQEMAQAALQARERISLQAMVNAFEQGVLDTVARKANERQSM